MSHILETFKISLTFEVVLMLLLRFFNVSVSLESAKNHWNRGLHLWRTPCFILSLIRSFWKMHYSQNALTLIAIKGDDNLIQYYSHKVLWCLNFEEIFEKNLSDSIIVDGETKHHKTLSLLWNLFFCSAFNIS